MGLRLSKLHECFKKLQSSGVVGQLQEAISQAGTAGSKKRKRDQQGENQTAETSATTESAKKKKKGKAQSSQPAAKAPKWCEDCQTAAHNALDCWNHPENTDGAHPGGQTGKEGGPGHEARSAMVLEELVSELMGLESQLHHQITPSRAGQICHGPWHGICRRGIGRGLRSDIQDVGRLRIGHGWVSLEAENF
jgi:hypothetical protein